MAPVPSVAPSLWPPPGPYLHLPFPKLMPDEDSRLINYGARGSLFLYCLESGLKRREDMFEPGTKIVMTKGYQGVKGVITEKTDSRFEFYIIKLDNGIHIVVGPSAFLTEKDPKHTRA